MYSEIEIDRENLTLMGVKFDSLNELENTANAIGSNMFEGFVPNAKSIELIRDYINDKISITELINISKSKDYVL
jgi:putative transcriptional regulator